MKVPPINTPGALTPDRKFARLEHLMAEITLDTPSATTIPSNTARTQKRSPVGTWRGKVVLGGLAAVTTSFLLTLTPLFDGPRGLGPTAFAVTQSPSTVSVEIIDTTAQAEQMTRQLQSQGLDITVSTAPASDQLVGTWLAVSAAPGVDENAYQAIVDQAIGHSSTLDIPPSIVGITVTIGVPAQAGEDDIAVTGLRNAFSPGGALECSAARGADPGTAQALLAASGYTTTLSEFPRFDVEVAPTPDAIVTAAYIHTARPDVVALTVLPADDERASAQLALGFAPSQLRAPGRC